MEAEFGGQLWVLLAMCGVCSVCCVVCVVCGVLCVLCLVACVYVLCVVFVACVCGVRAWVRVRVALCVRECGVWRGCVGLW